MKEIQIGIHRAANTIGGNCIEIVAPSGERLLIDAGRPLDAPERTPTQVPVSLKMDTPVVGILLSHAHMDHTGLLESLPTTWPVYCGKATKTLLQLASMVGRNEIAQPCSIWENGKTFALGPFTITPRLIDHSAFDAYALQIEVADKTIVYSGDFRAHGRKAKLTEAFIRTPPKAVDVLIMEGTNLERANVPPKPTLSEMELEEEFVRLFKMSEGRVFVSWSSTNIDRTVTLYRACKRTGRILVPDLYCTLVLMHLKEFGNIPQPEWGGGHMRAVVTKKMIYLANRLGETGLIEHLKKYRAAISAKKLTTTPERWVIMTRDSLVNDYAEKDVIPTEKDTWVWSLWSGYLKQDSTRKVRDFFAPCQKKYIHTSGHASQEDLQRFAKAMNPNILIPVHGETWAEHSNEFQRLTLMQDGEWLTI